MKLSVMVLITLVTLLTSCGENSEKDVSPPIVKYQVVNRSNGIRIRAFAGLTKPGVESKLSFRVAGLIDQLPAKVGDKVHKGDIIAKIDSTDFRLKVQEAEASLLQAKAQARHAAASYARIRELYETHSTSRNELDASRAQAESASAAVEAMQKKLELARSQFSYTLLRAPLDGSIASVTTEINENVGIGQPIVILNSGEKLEVKVSIPEILITQITKGDKVTVSFDAMPGEYFGGVVSEVGVASEAATTFLVTVELTQSSPGIRPGMAAEVFFQFQDRDLGYGIYVPSNAVIEDDNKHYIFVVDEKLGVVEKREVAVGQLTNGGIEINSGISEGEFVITAGIHLLQDGQKVRLKAD